MPSLGQSIRWTKAQRKAASVRMKQAYAKKKYNENQKKLEFEPVTYAEATNKPEVAVDLNHLRDFNYRRGLVAAMECILRELR